MKYTIFDVANWFLQKEEMTPKKLQKLCYYAQAWSLALKDSAIMDGVQFEAWVHGPVNYDLWQKCKGFGWNHIRQDYLKDVSKPIDREDEEILESVWETYGDLYGSQLEALTHTEDPWIKARGDLGAFDLSHENISYHDMKRYYKKIYIGDQGD